MNRKDLVNYIAEELLLTKKNVTDVVDLLIETMTSTLKNNEEVKLSGFGTFEVRSRKPRKGINPQTKQPFIIPGGKTLVFKPSRVLKEEIK